MITKDEEKFLEQCLNSVKGFVDEIAIVDTGSIDKTKDVAQKFGAKIFDFRWVDDFSAARNESIKHATKDWILVLDADEIIEKKDQAKIKDAIENAEKGVVGLAIEQRSYIKDFFEGAIENKSGFGLVKDFPFYIGNFLVRLFRNGLGLRFNHRIHELIEDSILEKGFTYKNIDPVIHHLGSVKDKTLIKREVEQYSKIILRQVEEDPNNARYNYQAGRLFVGNSNLSQALRFFKKTAKIDPNYKLVHSEIAKIYLQTGDKNKAIEYFKKSVQHNPENPAPANNLAVAYMSAGKFEQARKILEEQLKKYPDNKAFLHNYQKALEILRKR